MNENLLVQWLTLATRVMSEPLISSPVAMLIGETADNEDSVLMKGANLLCRGFVRRLVLPTRESEKFGFAGVDYCLHFLEESCDVNLGAVDILEHNPGLGDPNTMTELVCFAEYAKHHHLSGATVVAAPFHQLRSFVTAVTVALREMPTFRFQSCVGYPLDWSDSALHSQGTIQGTREDLFRGEVERIIRYQNPNNKPYPLTLVDEVLKYLNCS